MTDGRDQGWASVAAMEAEALERLKHCTPARIGLSPPGTPPPTYAALRFMRDHAQARDAVHLPLDFVSLEKAIAEIGWKTLRVRSAAADRATYLRRPDLGRRLTEESRATLTSAEPPADIAIIAADGLSSAALEANLVPLAIKLRQALSGRFSCGPIVLVEQGRVAIGDEIGALLGSRLALVLIGERPGLSAADSLGAYLTWGPKVGILDSARNCVSNIRASGLPTEAAAGEIMRLIEAAFLRRMTGVALSAALSSQSAQGQIEPR